MSHNKDWKRERRNARKNKEIRQTVYIAASFDKRDIRETRYI